PSRFDRRAIAWTGARLRRPLAAERPAEIGYPWPLGGRCGDGGTRLRLSPLWRRHFIEAFAVNLLRCQRQAELLADDTGKKAANRVLLPTGCFHNGGNRYTPGLAEKGKDRLLFGPTAA